MSVWLQGTDDLARGWARVCSDEGEASPHSQFGTALSGHVGPTVVDTAVEDLERALFRDRSHVVLVASPGPRKTEALRSLGRRLARSLHVVLLTDPVVGKGEICEQILCRMGQAPAAEAEQRLVRLVNELATKGSALMLLVNDANRMPEETLRCLGRLASNSQKGLRLGLAVVVEGFQEADPVAALVSVLGFGVEKVVLGEVEAKAEACAPSELRGTLPLASIEEAVLSPPRPPAERCGGRQTLSSDKRLVRWATRVTVALGTALAFLGAYQIAVPAASQEVALEPGPRPIEERGPSGSASPSEPRSAIPAVLHEAELQLRPGFVEPRDQTRLQPPSEREVQHQAALGRSREQPSQPAAVGRRVLKATGHMVAVSLNARPWARIEVDGRDVGLTPLGDFPMSSGPHRFRVHLADGRVLERVVSVDTYHDHLSFP